MRILSRYILFEFLKVFLVTLAGITILIMVFFVAVEARRQGIGLAQTLQIFPFLMPEALRFSVPGTMLFAVCNVYGRCGSSNEVVAIKSLGISPLVLFWPVLIVGVLFSGLCVWLNDAAVTWGRTGVQRVIIESVEDIAYNMLQTQRSYATEQLAISVRHVEGRRLIKPTFTIADGGDKPSITITADEAELRSDVQRGTLTIRFYNALIDVGNGDGGITWPGAYEHVVDFNDFSTHSEETGPSYVPLQRLPEEVKLQRQEIARLEEQTAARLALRMMTGRLEELAGRQWVKAEDRIAQARRTLYRLKAETPRRWANGFSCICFVLVGAPLAIRMRTRDFLTSFFLVFVPILLLYYPFLIVAVDRAKAGQWPPQSVWLGNLVFVLVGCWLIRKVMRY